MPLNPTLKLIVSSMLNKEGFVPPPPPADPMAGGMPPGMMPPGGAPPMPPMPAGDPMAAAGGMPPMPPGDPMAGMMPPGGMPPMPPGDPMAGGGMPPGMEMPPDQMAELPVMLTLGDLQAVLQEAVQASSSRTEKVLEAIAQKLNIELPAKEDQGTPDYLQLAGEPGAPQGAPQDVMGPALSDQAQNALGQSINQLQNAQ